MLVTVQRDGSLREVHRIPSQPEHSRFDCAAAAVQIVPGFTEPFTVYLPDGSTLLPSQAPELRNQFAGCQPDENVVSGSSMILLSDLLDSQSLRDLMRVQRQPNE